MSPSDDIPLVDFIAAYCAVNSCLAKTLQHKTFGEVLKLLNEIRDNHPEYVMASANIRRQYGICHEDCHIERILMVVNDMKDSPPKNPGVVVQFPSNRTKH